LTVAVLKMNIGDYYINKDKIRVGENLKC